MSDSSSHTSIKHPLHWISNLLHIFVLLTSLFLILTISLDTFRGISFLEERSYQNMQLWVCLFFMADFLIEWAIDPHKGHYFITHLLFFFVSIPYLSLVRYFQIETSVEMDYFLRFIPLVRGGYALWVVVAWFTDNKISTLLITYLGCLLSIAYFASLIFYVFEHAVNPLVTSYPKALWWAFMDVTTVGSNIYAVTPVGQVLSVLLAALGMMMFPIFTVYITTLIQKKKDDSENPPQ